MQGNKSDQQAMGPIKDLKVFEREKEVAKKLKEFLNKQWNEAWVFWVFSSEEREEPKTMKSLNEIL